MSAEIINGSEIADQILLALKKRIETLPSKPILAIVLVGDNESSLAYIRQKLRAADVIGVHAQVFHFLPTLDQKSLLDALAEIQKTNRVGESAKFLNPDSPFPLPDVAAPPTKPSGIIVQRPLPDHIDYEQILEALDPALDVDGFHPKSPFFAPVAEAVLYALHDAYDQEHGRGTIDLLAGVEDPAFVTWLIGQKIALVGHGQTAGLPISHCLHALGSAPTIITHTTKQPDEIARTHDIVISAVGKPGLITEAWIKPEAIVIDVGISRVMTPDGPRLKGDCDQSVWQVASYITPVPKGIGPINVACLMQNVYQNFV